MERKRKKYTRGIEDVERVGEAIEELRKEEARKEYLKKRTSINKPKIETETKEKTE